MYRHLFLVRFYSTYFFIERNSCTSSQRELKIFISYFDPLFQIALGNSNAALRVSVNDVNSTQTTNSGSAVADCCCCCCCWCCSLAEMIAAGLYKKWPCHKTESNRNCRQSERKEKCGQLAKRRDGRTYKRTTEQTERQTKRRTDE